MEEGTTTPVEGQVNVEPQTQATGDVQGGEPGGQPAQGFQLDTFNKTFETSFEDESSLRSALESANEAQNVMLELQQAKDKATKYDQFLEYYKPENLYGDDETYAFIEMRKKFPDRDPGLVSAIRGQGFESMSDLDKLLLADKLKVKINVPDSVRRENILQRLGIESDDVSELSEPDRYKIAAALADNMPILNEIRDFKPEPKVFDLANEKEAYEKRKADDRQILTQKVKPFAESIIKNYKGPKAYSKGEDGQLIEAFNYEVDTKEKAQFTESLVNAMVGADMEPTKENIQNALAYVDNHFKVLAFDRIVTAAIKHGQSLSAEKAHNEMHTDKPVNTQEAPKQVETQGLTLKERIRKNWDNKK